jgi:hypothetical protein
MDILGVPIAQFGANGSRPGTTATSDMSFMNSGPGVLFRPADFVSPKNASIPNDISAITLMEKFPKVTANALMSHGSLNFENICVGNKGACLDYNLLSICTDSKCTYRHARAKPTTGMYKPSQLWSESSKLLMPSDQQSKDTWTLEE